MCQEPSSTSQSPSRQPSVPTEAMPPPLTLLGSVITRLRWHISDKRQGTPLPLVPGLHSGQWGLGALNSLPGYFILSRAFFSDGFPAYPSTWHGACPRGGAQ